MQGGERREGREAEDDAVEEEEEEAEEEEEEEEEEGFATCSPLPFFGFFLVWEDAINETNHQYTSISIKTHKK